MTHIPHEFRRAIERAEQDLINQYEQKVLLPPLRSPKTATRERIDVMLSYIKPAFAQRPRLAPAEPPRP